MKLWHTVPPYKSVVQTAICFRLLSFARQAAVLTGLISKKKVALYDVTPLSMGIKTAGGAMVEVSPFRESLLNLLNVRWF